MFSSRSKSALPTRSKGHGKDLGRGKHDKKAVDSKALPPLPPLKTEPAVRGLSRHGEERPRETLYPWSQQVTSKDTNSRSTSRPSQRSEESSQGPSRQERPVLEGQCEPTEKSTGRNFLRRKPSASTRTDTTTSSRDRHAAEPTKHNARSLPERRMEPASETVFGIAPPPVPSQTINDRHQTFWPFPKASTPESHGSNGSHGAFHPPLPPIIPPTASPSTRYSESPGPFSRTSTPTTISSYSPSVAHYSRATPKLRQPSPSYEKSQPLRQRRYAAESNESLGHSQQPPSAAIQSQAAERVSPETMHPPVASKDGMQMGQGPKPPPRKSSMKFKPSTGPSSTGTSRIARPATKEEKGTPNTSASNSRSTSTAPIVARRRESTSESERRQIPRPSLEAPRRPSRDGTEHLDPGLDAVAPIVRSNLKSPPRPGTQRPSASEPQRERRVLQKPARQEPDRKASSRPTKNAPSSVPSQPSSRNQSSTSLPALARPAAPPARPAQSEANSSRGASPMRGVSSRSTTRLALFSRRKKLATEEETSSGLNSTSARKGPAAGTGHEGYGKYATRGRSGSSTSGASGSWARSGSNSSGARSNSSRRDSYTSKGTHEVDDFFLDRLEPVVLTGGKALPESSQSKLDLTKLHSNQSSNDSRPSMDSMRSASTQFSMSSQEEFGQRMERAQQPDTAKFSSPSKNPFHGLRRLGKKKTPRGSDEKASRDSPPRPLREAFLDFEQPEHYYLDQAGPINEGTIQEGREGHWLRPMSKGLAEKPSTPRRQNFAERTQAPIYHHEPPKAAVGVTVQPVNPTPSFVHYALLDRGEAVDSDDLEALVNEIQNQPESGYQSESSGSRHERLRESMLLPERPFLQCDDSFSRDAEVRKSKEPLPVPTKSPGRQPRLAQVGRIPKVVSTRNLKESSSAEQSGSEKASMARRTPSSASRSASQRKGSLQRSSTNGSSRSKPSLTRSPASYTRADEFLHFSPPDSSHQSDSSFSLEARLNRLEAERVAVTERSREEDVWNEYDDFIDAVLPVVPSSSKGVSFCQPSFGDPNEKLLKGAPQKTNISEESEQDDRQVNAETRQLKTKSSLDAGMNVRFAALMTSKWLSFGQVLFSPAHRELKRASAVNRQNKLLILDGLGNDDWSYYCALTYPNATVYNLSTSPSNSSRQSGSGAWQSPTNHRQIFHPSIGNPFPFPRGFFCAVVFRFPQAASEEVFRSALCESKRVLRPGGYLEASVMDLDMMNMGHSMRRAVKDLKLQMHLGDDSISLRSISDNLQRSLGRRGFENIYRCTLGLPTTGEISSADSYSRSNSVDENGRSLNDLIRDESREGDVAITKMVAKVGRWWYSRCYEAAVVDNAPEGNPYESVWYDPALLRECEDWKTSFKLFICFAQKPMAPKRRTVSV